LCGRQDGPTPPEVHQKIAAGIEGAKLDHLRTPVQK
jgi:hypothetical protein